MNGLPKTTRRIRSAANGGLAMGLHSDAVGRHALLISIQPRYSEAILAGSKTVELRRKAPRELHRVVIIYSSGSSRTVVGTAELTDIHTSTPSDIWTRFGHRAGVTRDEYDAYFEGSETASALELERPRRSEPGLPLAALRQVGVEPPQSWRYLDRQQAGSILAALERESGQPSRVRSPRTSAVGLLGLTFSGLTTRAIRPLQTLTDAGRCLRREAFDSCRATSQLDMTSFPKRDLR